MSDFTKDDLALGERMFDLQPDSPWIAFCELRELFGAMSLERRQELYDIVAKRRGELDKHHAAHHGDMSGRGSGAKLVEFRGRQVVDTYPERHAQAQGITSYDDFTDGVERARIPYGDARDRYPGGITYATRDERIAYRIKFRQDALVALLEKYGPAGSNHDHAAYLEELAWVDSVFPHAADPNDLIEPGEVVRTDHRCPDCGVEVGEYHLPGCDCEVCPRCTGQAIGCDCSEAEDEQGAPGDDQDDD